MTAPSVLPGRAFASATRQSDLLLGWRASDMSLDAYTGQSATYSRASSGGSVVGTGSRQWLDTDNQLRLTGASPDDAPSWEWVLNADGVYVPALTLSGALTNLVTDDDLTAWTDNGATAPTVTSGITDPAGGTGAYRIEDDSAVNLERKYREITFTGDGVKAFVTVVREATMASSGFQGVGVFQLTGTSGWKGKVTWPSWTGGKPDAVAGSGATLLSVRYVGDGYWAIYWQSASITAAETNQIWLEPAVTTTATGSFDIYRFNAYNSVVPCPKILNASVAHAAEGLYWDLPDTFVESRSFSVYTKHIERGTWAATTYKRLWSMGAVAGKHLNVRTNRTNGGPGYGFAYENGVNTATSGSLSTASGPSFGDEVEMLLTMDASGEIQLTQWTNGVYADDYGRTADGYGFENWNASPRFVLNQNAAGTGDAFNSFLEVKVAARVKTMQQMREAF